MIDPSLGTSNPGGVSVTEHDAASAEEVMTVAGVPVPPVTTARCVGRQFKVPRTDASLPPYCVRCGKPTGTTIDKTFWWYSPLLYLLLIVPIFYIIAVLVLRKSCRLAVPVCDKHRSSYRMKRMIGGILMAVSVPLWVAFVSLGNDNEPLMLAGVLVFFVLMIGGAIVFNSAPLIRPASFDSSTAMFKGASERFLQHVPE